MTDEPIILLHRIMTRKEATERIREILDRWEKLGFKKPNDVPPEDRNIPEFLSIMKGLGFPEMEETYLKHYEGIMGSKATKKLRGELGL